MSSRSDQSLSLSCLRGAWVVLVARGQLDKEESNVALCFDAIMGIRICAGGEHGQGNKDNCRFGRRGAAQGN